MAGSFGSLAWARNSKMGAPSDVKQYFETYLETHISIGKGIRARASSSHNALREFLRTEHSRDATFPVLLEDRDRDFIGGSFARHTKVWPLDDIDIYFPIDGRGLLYWKGGSLTCTTVVSDGKIWSNPLLTSRWMNGNWVSSLKVHEGFNDVLRRRYPDRKIEAADESVSIQTSIGASESSDGLNFDAVASFLIQPNDRSQSYYLIPDGNDHWIQTNPRLDEDICSSLHSYHNETFRPAVRLLKFWVTAIFKDKFGSYYVELACMRHFLGLKNAHQVCSRISAALLLAFEGFAAAAAAGEQLSFTPGALPVKPKGLVTAENSSLIRFGATKAREAWDFEARGNYAQAIATWKCLFGDA